MSNFQCTLANLLLLERHKSLFWISPLPLWSYDVDDVQVWSLLSLTSLICFVSPLKGSGTLLVMLYKEYTKLGKRCSTASWFCSGFFKITFSKDAGLFMTHFEKMKLIGILQLNQSHILSNYVKWNGMLIAISILVIGKSRQCSILPFPFDVDFYQVYCGVKKMALYIL